MDEPELGGMALCPGMKVDVKGINVTGLVAVLVGMRHDISFRVGWVDALVRTQKKIVPRETI